MSRTRKPPFWLRPRAVPFWLRPRAVPFWLRPKWVVGHVLVVALVALFVSLGFWQLRRLDERRERNAEISARSEMPAAPVEDVVPLGAQLGDVEDLRYRLVTVSGTYDAEGEVLIRPRSLDGVSGWHVVTPLVLEDGRAVLVTRGFAPLTTDPEVAQAAAAPPEGDVTVTGLVFPSQARQSIGPTDPEDGTLLELARVDIGRIRQQYGGDLLPVYVQLGSQDPPLEEPGLPRLLPIPATDEGTHFSYAVQWFLFAGVGLVGWPILLRRTGREESQADRTPPAVGPEPGPGDDDGPAEGRGGGGSERPSPGEPREPVGAGQA